MKNKMLRMRHVVEYTGVSRCTIYRWMNAGTFPRSIRLGEQSVAWLEAEVDAWIQDRIDRSREATNAN